MSNSLRPHGLWPASLLYPWNSPGKNTRAGCHFLLQVIFLTQGSNPSLLCLLYWQPGGPPGKPPASLRSSQIPGNEVGMRDIAWKEKSELGNVPGHPGARGRYGAILCGLFCLFLLRVTFFFLFRLHWVIVATCELSLVAASRGYSSLRAQAVFCFLFLFFFYYSGFSCGGAQALGAQASVATACGL